MIFRFEPQCTRLSSHASGYHCSLTLSMDRGGTRMRGYTRVFTCPSTRASVSVSVKDSTFTPASDSRPTPQASAQPYAFANLYLPFPTGRNLVYIILSPFAYLLSPLEYSQPDLAGGAECLLLPCWMPSHPLPQSLLTRVGGGPPSHARVPWATLPQGRRRPQTLATSSASLLFPTLLLE